MTVVLRLASAHSNSPPAQQGSVGRRLGRATPPTTRVGLRALLLLAFSAHSAYAVESFASLASFPGGGLAADVAAATQQGGGGSFVISPRFVSEAVTSFGDAAFLSHVTHKLAERECIQVVALGGR